MPSEQAATARRLPPSKSPRTARVIVVFAKSILPTSSLSPLFPGFALAALVLSQTFHKRHETHRQDFFVVEPVIAPRHFDEALHMVRLAHR